MKLNILFASITLLCAAQAAVASPIPDETFTDIEAFGLKELLEALLNIVNKMYDEIRKAAKESEGSLVKLVDNSVKVIQDSADEAMAEIQKLADEVAEQQIEEITDEVAVIASPHPDGTDNEVEAVSEVETVRLDPLISLTRIIKNLPTGIRNAVIKSQGSGIAVVDNSLKAILDSSDDALREIQRMVDDISDEINADITDEARKKCHDKFRPKNQEEIDNFYSQVRVCGDEFREKIVESVTQVVPLWEEIVESFSETIDEVKECLDETNFTRMITCGVQEIMGAKQLYLEKLSEFTNLVSEELLETVELTRSAYECIQGAYEEKTENISNIDDEINKCQDVETD